MSSKEARLICVNRRTLSVVFGYVGDDGREYQFSAMATPRLQYCWFCHSNNCEHVKLAIKLLGVEPVVEKEIW